MGPWLQPTDSPGKVLPMKAPAPLAAPGGGWEAGGIKIEGRPPNRERKPGAKLGPYFPVYPFFSAIYKGIQGCYNSIYSWYLEDGLPVSG